MRSATIRREPVEVTDRLARLGVTKDELLDVVGAAVAARNDAVDHDPSNAAGWLAYCYGTRKLRETYCPKGWVLDRQGGVESVIHPASGMKMVYQNADSAGREDREPQPVSSKGEASKALINSVNGDLFREWPADGEASEGSVWYLLVEAEGEHVTAELSCPQAVEGGRFSGYIERIFLVESGDDQDWEKLAQRDDEIEDQDFDITVTRK